MTEHLRSLHKALGSEKGVAQRPPAFVEGACVYACYYSGVTIKKCVCACVGARVWVLLRCYCKEISEIVTYKKVYSGSLNKEGHCFALVAKQHTVAGNMAEQNCSPHQPESKRGRERRPTAPS